MAAALSYELRSSSRIISGKGVFQASNGNLYAVTVDVANDVIYVEEGGSDGTSWTAPNSWTPTGNPTLYGIGVGQNGNVLHIAVQDHINSTIYYRQFTMVTDSWGTEQSFTAGGFLSSGAIYCHGRSDGSVVVVGALDSEKVHGTSYPRPAYVIRSTGGTWGTVTRFEANSGASNYGVFSFAVGLSDKVYTAWGITGTGSQTITARSLNSSDTLGTARTVTTVAQSPYLHAGQMGDAINPSGATAERVYIPITDSTARRLYYADDDGTWTAISVLDGAATIAYRPTVVANRDTADAHEIRHVWPDTALGTYFGFYFDSNEDGGSFGTDTDTGIDQQNSFIFTTYDPVFAIDLGTDTGILWQEGGATGDPVYFDTYTPSTGQTEQLAADGANSSAGTADLSVTGDIDQIEFSISAGASEWSPPIRVGTAFYVVGRDQATDDFLRVMKSTDDGDTWSSVATKQITTSDTLSGALAVFLHTDGDIHIAVEAFTTGASFEVRYLVFDPGTDAFLGTNEQVTTYTIAGGITTFYRTLDLAVRSDGSVVVLHAYQDQSSFDTIRYSRRSSGGTWTSNIAISANEGSKHLWSGTLALGSSDRVHFFWWNVDTSTDLRHRTLNSSNVLQTEQTVRTGIAAFIGWQRAARYVEGSDVVIGRIYDRDKATWDAHLGIVYATSADNPSWTDSGAITDTRLGSDSNGLGKPYLIGVGENFVLVYIPTGGTSVYYDGRAETGITDIDTGIDALGYKNAGYDVYTSGANTYITWWSAEDGLGETVKFRSKLAPNIRRKKLRADTGPNAADGTADLSVSATVGLAADGPNASDGDAALSVTKALAADGDAASEGTADLTRTAGLASDGPNASDGTADLDVIVLLEGAGANSADGDADLSVGTIIALAADGPASSAGTAALEVTKSLAADGPASSDGSGLLTCNVPVASDGPNSADGTAALDITKTLAADGPAASEGTADLDVIVLLEADGANASDGDADLTVGTIIALESDGANAAEGDASLVVTRGLAADGPNATAGTAAITVTRGLAGSGPSASAGSADIDVFVPLAGSGEAASDGDAALSVLRPLAATGPNVSNSPAADLDVERQISATGPAASSGTAVLEVTKDLSGSGPSSTTGTANLSIEKSLEADGPNSSDGTAVLTVAGDVQIAADGPASSAGTADLTADLALAADSANSADGTAEITIRVPLAGDGPASSAGTADLERIRRLEADGASSSDGDADLTVTAGVIDLASDGPNASDGTADLGRRYALAADGPASSTGYGDLDVVVLFTADGPAASDGTAALDVAGDVQLEADGPNTSAGTAGLDVDRPIAADGPNSSEGAGSLTVFVPLEATGAASAAGSAALDRLYALAADGANSSNGSATVQIVRGLDAYGPASSDGTAAVDLDLALVGAGANAATGDAALSVAAATYWKPGPPPWAPGPPPWAKNGVPFDRVEDDDTVPW